MVGSRCVLQRKMTGPVKEFNFTIMINKIIIIYINDI